MSQIDSKIGPKIKAFEDSFKKYTDNQKSHKMNTYNIEKDLLNKMRNA